MSANVDEAACVVPPVASKVYVRATVTSSERLEIPAECRGHYVTFQAQGQDAFLVFGGAAVAASASAASSVASEVLTANATSTVHIPAGTSLHVDLGKLPPVHTHIAHISSSTAGFLRFWRSGGTAV